jgi:hypothetical protein
MSITLASLSGEWKMEIGRWRMEVGDWRLKVGDWRLEDGGWASLEGFPPGHQGPKHGAHLVVTGSEPRMFASLDVLAVEGKIQPQLGLLRFAQRVVETILEDILIAPLGETFNDVATYPTR